MSVRANCIDSEPGRAQTGNSRAVNKHQTSHKVQAKDCRSGKKHNSRKVYLQTVSKVIKSLNLAESDYTVVLRHSSHLWHTLKCATFF